MIDLLKEFVSIPSVLQEAKDNAPFGQPLRDSLDLFLKKASSLGLKTKDGNGYYGWAEYGEGDTCIGFACHVDVVPATGDWDYPKYDLTEKDGLLYGRGVADDKNAIAIGLKLLENLKNDNVKLNHRIRLIVGCNEENGSLCMAEYVKNEEIPAFTIVPDADFPVINSEKGILHFTVKAPLSPFVKANLFALNGGKRPNIVPDYCEAHLSQNAIDVLVKTEHASDFTINGNVVYTTGIAGHAMCPHRGKNAVYSLIKGLADVFTQDATLTSLSKICKVDASKDLGIYKSDEQSGDLTVNLGMINFDGEDLAITFDCRLPINCDHNEVCSAITNAIEGAQIIEKSFSPNLFISADRKEIKALVGAYCTVTGDTPHCLHTGGGTYARALPNAVAYGPTFEGVETQIHNANECYPIKDLYRALDIYTLAIKELDKVID